VYKERLIIIVVVVVVMIIISIITTTTTTTIFVTGLPGTSSLQPAVIPTAQASSFRLQYFPYYV
jgi:hypothetical protein